MQWLVWPGGQPTLSNTTSPHNFPLPLSQWERQVLKSLCKMILAFLLNIKSFMNEWFVVWLRPKGGGWRVGDLIKSKARRSVFQKRSEIFVIVITQVIRPVKLGWTYYIKIYLFILWDIYIIILVGVGLVLLSMILIAVESFSIRKSKLSISSSFYLSIYLSSIY